MNLKKILCKDSIIMDLKSQSKDEILAELTDYLVADGKVSDREGALAALKEREAKMSTGMSNGIAIPHAKTDIVKEMVALIGELTADSQRKYITAYWPEFDSLAHSCGIGSETIADHFTILDNAIEKLHAEISRNGARLLITADHGLIDTDEQHTIRLDHHPQLADYLALPLCGEPRTAYCYVRPGLEEQFERYISNHLEHACSLVKSEQLIASGYFGLGDSHPQLQFRVGDYTLLMKENYVIRDRLLTEKPFSQIGVHGGLSEQELYVPLIIPGS